MARTESHARAAGARHEQGVDIAHGGRVNMLLAGLVTMLDSWHMGLVARYVAPPPLRA